MADKATIKVMTLNCWGIVYVSKDRRPRMYAIAKHLSRCDADLVSLQEVWSVRDYIFLSRKALPCLPYSHYFNSGVNGPGLCVLSKYPIVDVYFHQWPINGYAHKIHQGDWFGGKGVGLCKVKMGNRIINFYVTHLHAEYDLEKLDYLNHRLLQSFDTSQFIKLTSKDCDLAILAGDLNSEPHDPAISLLLLNAQLTDSFKAAQLKSAGCIGTNESYRNSYAPSKELKRQPEGKRIDYILYKTSPTLEVNTLEYLFPLPDRVPGCPFSYSDHEAVQVIFEWSPVSTKKEVEGATGDVLTTYSSESKDRLESVLIDSLQVCDLSLKKLVKSKRTYVTSAIIFACMLIATLFVELFFNIPPDGYKHSLFIVLYNFLKVIITSLFLFTILMGTLWNNMEQSAILTGKYSMRLLLNQLTEAKIADDSL